MRIAIDFTSAARERAGIGRYARELIRALSRLDRANQYRLFVPLDAHADLLAFDWPPNFAIVHAPLTERVLAALWHRARVPLPVEFFIGRVDVFYSPDFLLPPTWARRKLVTVHDLSYVRLPECFPAVLKRYLDNAVPRSLKRADLVLADAQSTRADLVDVYRLAPDRIKVLYSGVDARFCAHLDEAARMRVAEKYRLGDPYLLSVSTIQPRKNNVRLIRAFARLLPRLGAPLSLVIAGGEGWMYDEVYRVVDELDLRHRVKFLGFTADEDLPALYSMATLFVYPSLYEGFGLPVAEAMACGVPVVCSNSSSLPEVGGSAVLYFDPCNVDEMADVIGHALKEPAIRSRLQAQGLEQVKQFTWERSAQALLEYLYPNTDSRPEVGRNEH